MPRDPLEETFNEGEGSQARVALSRDKAELLRAARDSQFTGDAVLALLQRRDLPSEVLEALSHNREALKDRKVAIALVTHPRTPRYIWLPMLRHLFSFELMRIALMPTASGDLKIAADQAILARMEKISIGERISLARQGSGMLASALLADPEPRVVQAALANPRLTETGVIRALNGEREERMVTAVATHPRWSLRIDIQLALLKQKNLPLAHAIGVCDHLSGPQCRMALQETRLPDNVKRYLEQKVELRTLREER